MEKLLQEQIELTEGDVEFLINRLSELNKESKLLIKDLAKTKERIEMLIKRRNALNKKLKAIRGTSNESNKKI